MDSDKAVSYSGTPEQVELECEALALLDKATESKKSILLVSGVVSVFALFGAFVISSMLLGGLAIVAIGGIGAYYYSINDDDIEDRKLNLARWLVDTLKPELKANRPVQLDLDFRGYDNPKTDGSWMTLAMTLEDGVGLRLSISTHFKRKTRAKRKYTKIKDKLHERVSLTFVAPKGRSFDPAGKDRFKSHPVPKLQLRSVKISPKAATIVYSTPQMQRVSGRGGWSNVGLDNLVQGSTSVAAIIASYRALGVAAGSAAGGV